MTYRNSTEGVEGESDKVQVRGMLLWRSLGNASGGGLTFYKEARERRVSQTWKSTTTNMRYQLSSPIETRYGMHRVFSLMYFEFRYAFGVNNVLKY
jgi:hypothetical protein